MIVFRQPLLNGIDIKNDLCTPIIMQNITLVGTNVQASAKTSALFGIPQVGYSATSRDLNDKTRNQYCRYSVMVV